MVIGNKNRKEVVAAEEICDYNENTPIYRQWLQKIGPKFIFLPEKIV
jgi:hypothetical protein